MAVNDVSGVSYDLASDPIDPTDRTDRTDGN
jgi:hypothetical protein